MAPDYNGIMVQYDLSPFFFNYWYRTFINLNKPLFVILESVHNFQFNIFNLCQSSISHLCNDTMVNSHYFFTYRTGPHACQGRIPVTRFLHMCITCVKV